VRPQHDEDDPGYSLHSSQRPSDDAGELLEEPLDPELSILAEHVVSDLEADGAIHIQLSQRPGPPPRVVLVTIGRAKYGFGVDPAFARADLLVALAEGIQEHLPETETGWSEPRPRCPRHPHPLEPRVIEGDAYWVCPTDERKGVVKIGEHRRLAPQSGV
jgi:hypothetical protein